MIPSIAVLCRFVALSPRLTVPLCLCVSVFLCLGVSVSLCLCVSVSLPLRLSVSLRLSLPKPLSFSLPLSRSLARSLSLSCVALACSLALPALPQGTNGCILCREEDTSLQDYLASVQGRDTCVRPGGGGEGRVGERRMKRGRAQGPGQDVLGGREAHRGRKADEGSCKQMQANAAAEGRCSMEAAERCSMEARQIKADASK